MNVITNPDVSLKTVLKTGGSTRVYSKFNGNFVKYPRKSS